MSYIVFYQATLQTFAFSIQALSSCKPIPNTHAIINYQPMIYKSCNHNVIVPQMDMHRLAGIPILLLYNIYICTNFAQICDLK